MGFAQKAARVVLPGALLALGALLIGLLVPWWIRGGISYIAVVLLALWTRLRRLAFAAASTATALIIISDFVPKHEGTPLWMIIPHCALWVTAIWATILLTLLRSRSEEERTAFYDLSLDLLCIGSLDGTLKRVNRLFETTLGRAAHELISRPFIDVVHPDDRGVVTREIEKLSAGISPVAFEIRQPHCSGSYRWIAWTAVPLLGKGSFYATGRDTTEDRRRTEALRESEEKYRLLVDGIQDHAIFMVDTAGNVVSWNAAAERTIGYRAEDIIGRPYSDFYTREDIQAGKPLAVLRTAEAEGRFEEEGWRVRRDGSRRWVHAVILPLRDPDGSLRGFCVNRRDLSEQRQTQEALRDSQHFADRVLQTTPDQIYVYDLLQRRIVYANRHLADFLGGAALDQGGETVFLEKTLHPDDLPVLPDLLQRLNSAQDDEVIETEFRRRGTSGAFHWMRTRYVVLSRGDKRAPQEILCAAVDITERRQALEALRSSEAALLQNQKILQSLTSRLITAEEEQRKRFARDLHDDLNQRVTVMAINTAKLERELPLSSDLIRDSLQKLQDQLGTLSDDIRLISHQLHPATLDHLGLRAAIEAECQTFSQLAGIPVDCLSVDLPELADEVALCLFRVLQEALKNVLKHAHASRTKVYLETTEREVVLRIEDDGVGFNPSSTATKAGLGLVSMEERARLVGGALLVSSRAGLGTKVEARVPISGRRP